MFLTAVTLTLATKPPGQLVGTLNAAVHDSGLFAVREISVGPVPVGVISRIRVAGRGPESVGVTVTVIAHSVEGVRDAGQVLVTAHSVAAEPVNCGAPTVRV